MAYIYTPFMKKVLHITELELESNIQHHSRTDDLGAYLEVTKMASFLSSHDANWSPCPPQPILL
jgi:hypothetical protein